jgi:hypothetical protein
MSDPENFDWSYRNMDVVVAEQRSLAVYCNNFGQAVIRVERSWDEEADRFVIIDHAQIPTVIKALRDIGDAPIFRTEPAPVENAQ